MRGTGQDRGDFGSEAADAVAVPAAQAELFGTVFVLTQLLSRRADEALASLGLTSKQWLLLAVLTRRFPGTSPTLGEAAAWYGTSRQNVKQIARQLERRGWLRIEPDARDRRALRLRVTPRVAAFDEPAEVRRQKAFLAGLFAPFTPAEHARLLGLLRRWLAAVAPGDAPGASAPRRAAPSPTPRRRTS